MYEWMEKSLTELADFVMGQSPESFAVSEQQGGLPFLQGCAEFGQINPEPKFYVHPPLRVAPVGSTLISVRAPVGTMNEADQSYGIGRGLAAIVGKKRSNQFLRYAIEMNASWLHRRSQGSTFLAIGSDDLRKLPIMVSDNPDRCEAAAKVISLIDTQIEATQALIAKQERVRAGLMQDLFTRGVDEHGRLRPPNEKAPHFYHQTELGWLPKGWEVSGLKGKGPINGGHLKTGPFGSSLKIEHWVPQGRPVITIGSLGEGILEHEELLYVSDETATRLEAYQLAPGDVVFSRVADVGRSVVIEPDNSGWIMSSNLMRIRLDVTKVRPRFLHLQLAFNAVLRTQVRRSINSGGRDVANAAVLNSLKFAWPTPYEQDQIIVAAGKLDAENGFLKEGLLKLRLQRLGLMQDLLTGKVSVAPLLEGVAA
jgi:type I restriction enzyme S subunit